MIFKRIGDGRPYPDHGLSSRGWAAVPPRQVRLDELVTTKDTLQLAALLDDPRGVIALRAYFAPYVALARSKRVGLVLDAPTWRASSHWGKLLGYTADELAAYNRRAVALLEDVDLVDASDPVWRRLVAEAIDIDDAAD